MPSETFALVAPPTGSDLLGFLGWQSDPELVMLADRHARMTTLAARSHCRSRGWQKVETSGAEAWLCPEDVAVAILTCAARSLSNPEQARQIQAGNYQSQPGSAWSWSLLERLTLDGYRLRAG